MQDADRRRAPHVPEEGRREIDDVSLALFAALDLESSGKISKHRLLDHLREVGIQSDDPRIAAFLHRLMQSPNAEITSAEFAEFTKPSIVLIRKALQGDLVIPDFPGYRRQVMEIFDALREDTSGQVASYIPQLAKISPTKFGVAVCTIDGQRFSFGDAREHFSIQSISKTISYCLALEGFGENVVHEHVGREPSGSSFNAITLDARHRPHNPLINAGAIMCSSMIQPANTPAERFEYVLSFWERLVGIGKPLFNNTVYLSEKQTADRNFALAYFMSEKKTFPKNTNLAETLDLYFQCCSIEVTCEGLAAVAATLAKGGVNPLTGDRVLDARTVKHCLSLMGSCGMYDFSGEFAFTIGLPAKSGVGGGLMIVIPNVMGICVWSPPLDPNGNSVRGVRFCQELVRRFNFHTYDSLVAGDTGKTDPRKKQAERSLDRIVALCWACAQGDLGEIQQLIAAGADVNGADYDGRTALHLAASEGHLGVVEFLVRHGADAAAEDRWGNTPLDDAIRGDHEMIVAYMRASGS